MIDNVERAIQPFICLRCITTKALIYLGHIASLQAEVRPGGVAERRIPSHYIEVTIHYRGWEGGMLQHRHHNGHGLASAVGTDFVGV